MISKIFLDLDGVIRDWDGGIIKWYDLPIKHEDITNWGWIEDYMFHEHQMSAKEFWEGQTDEFWKNLGMLPEANRLLSFLDSLQTVDTFILTSPTLNNAGGSQAWIRKNMPKYFNAKRYLIGPCKYACACSDSLLIDDCEKNVHQWEEWGGLAFLWPQPWNYNRNYIRYAFDDLQEFLKKKGVMPYGSRKAEGEEECAQVGAASS